MKLQEKKTHRMLPHIGTLLLCQECPIQNQKSKIKNLMLLFVQVEAYTSNKALQSSHPSEIF